MSVLLALPLVMSPVIYFVGHTFRAALSRLLVLLTLAVMGVCFLLILGSALPARLELGTVALRIDALSLLFVALMLVVMLLVVVFSGAEIGEKFGGEKYYALLLILTGALIGICCAADLFNLWLWFELMVVSTYFLIAFRRNHPPALEATVKYLVQSTLGSVMVLFGVALTLAQTGSLSLEEHRLVGGVALDAAGAFLFIGFGVKLALIPLHTWLPDAYSQSPDAISTLQSALVTQSGLIALLRALSPLSTFAELLLIFGVINIVVGNLLALRQQDLKRLLAYSSLTHIGFILLGIGLGLAEGTPDGIRSGLFHLLNHGLMKGLAFLAAGALLMALGRQQGGTSLRIDDLSGAARRAPLAALALTLALLSLAGIPPLAGFMSKWQIFAAGITAGSPALVVLILFAALNSVFSLAYYLPVVNALFKPAVRVSPVNGSPSAADDSAMVNPAPLPLAMQIPLVVLSAALIVVGLLPDAFTWLTAPASLALIG